MAAVCPFGHSTSPSQLGDGAKTGGSTAATKNKETNDDVQPARRRIVMLYEEYVHLPLLKQVWDNPVTEKPHLEPLFAAAMQGVELCFLLMGEFVRDSRSYVAKRPRIELLANDIRSQCALLSEVVGSELEEGAVAEDAVALTGDFPFCSGPPRVQRASHSPGLRRLLEAIEDSQGALTTAEHNSLVKVVHIITCAFQAAFSRWTVGFGIEGQWNALRRAVGLEALPGLAAKSHNLDYALLVKPHLVAATLTEETYEHEEDFFFRSIHLGTECWALVAHSRLQCAARFVEEGDWHCAAARVIEVAGILRYLGDHVMLLTSMNLRDYLYLKVELEGTSGDGSVQVKTLRGAIKALYPPLEAAATAAALAAAADAIQEGGGEAAILSVYEDPDAHVGLYNYAKALETVEAGLLGGFYYQHFRLAATVIGSDAKGTMNRAVTALKRTYETPVFPQLDAARSLLGARTDAKLAHMKGRMMEDIEAQQGSAVRKGEPPLGREPREGRLRVAREEAEKAAEGASAAKSEANGSVELPKTPSGFEAARQRLYSSAGVPPVLAEAAEALRAQYPGLPFLDHAWGQMPPAAHTAAIVRQYALYQLGNAAWDVVFGDIIPEAVGHVRHVLNLPADDSVATVQFGHNSHELVFRLLSSLLVTPMAGGPPVRLLTSDTEFYSLTRQVSRLVAEGLVQLRTVAAHPVATYPARLVAAMAAEPFDVVVTSQTTYLHQETLIPDVAALVTGLRRALRQQRDSQGSGPAAQPGAAEAAGAVEPLIIVDGYHCFGALSIDLAAVADQCCYVGGLLKHVGCGANAAFVSLPARTATRPAFTGWLADPSVLAPGSAGLRWSDKVDYSPGTELAGATPAFVPALLMFNEVMRRWQAAVPQAITVARIHAHVMNLHERFLAGLARLYHPAINLGTLHAHQPPASRSHTLVFTQSTAAAAAETVASLCKHQIVLDCRGCSVRVGFGLNHSLADVERLLVAIAGSAADVA